MTQVAIVQPQYQGGNWWGVVEVPWSKQDGPRYPKLMMAALQAAPVIFHETHVPPPPIENVEVEFVPLISNQGGGDQRRLWIAHVNGSVEDMRLLNIAYTCPSTHVHWEDAIRIRSRFERALQNS